MIRASQIMTKIEKNGMKVIYTYAGMYNEEY